MRNLFLSCRIPAGKQLRVAFYACLLLTVGSRVGAYAQDDGTVYVTVSGIDNLSGIDPSSANVAGNYDSPKPTDDTKVMCFYNVGAKRFLSIGGLWGTHASLNNTPHALWLETGSADGNYYVNNPVAGSGTGTHIGENGGDLWMDRSKDNGNGKGAVTISFEKAGSDYNDNNKVYYIKTSNGNYITAYPGNEAKFCNMQKALDAANIKNQEWKIITKAEYYTLFLANPATMASSVDASFLLKSPDFRVNDTDKSYWLLGGVNASEAKKHLFFGDNKMYNSYDNRGKTGVAYTTGYSAPHQQNYGKYFYCYSKATDNYNLYQDVEVHKAGWYVLRCNGFSTMKIVGDNGSVKPQAHLFTTVLDKDGKPVTTQVTAATLNLLDPTTAKALIDSEDGAGAGKAFFEGVYENQVQICVEKAADGGEISVSNPLKLRIGFFVDKGNGAADDDDIVCVDNFKLLYAGPRRNPELILNEDFTDLRYLSKATDTYTNSVLHLKRTFNDNKWNSLVLPVSLTAGQLKRTFGDNVKVAKLEKLTDNSAQFVTVETKNDDEVALKAFEPYIIYPPVVDVSSAAYTVDKFYTGKGNDNSHWLGTDYNVSADENNHLSLTVPANHYDITMVSLNRDDFSKYVDTNNWVSQTIFSADGSLGHMVCYGTMAKTYDEKGIISGRDDLHGDYFMYKGEIWQVPDDQQYGLKGFRCWFELKGRQDEESSLKQMSLYIDGVEDSTTGIDDVHAGQVFSARKQRSVGVYNMNGQKVRGGASVEGLPKGLYIVNGKKVVVK